MHLRSLFLGFSIGIIAALALLARFPREQNIYADGYLLRVKGDTVRVLWEHPDQRILPPVEIAPGVDIWKGATPTPTPTR